MKTSAKAGTNSSAKQNLQTAVITVKPASTGDSSNVNLWLVLMILAACAALIAAFPKKRIMME